MPKFYFTLAALEDGLWATQFGDYDRFTVEEELEDMAQANLRKNLRIVKTLDSQAAINAAIAKLNA